MDFNVFGTNEKAHKFNMDSQTHGSFAEIGAGQEVARWFFKVGGAARTVAKTISAYDMAISDALYGPAQRYVSRQRLEAMLAQEFDQLVDGLGATKGAATTFFAFADTVATRKPGHKENGRGWVGIRFQTQPHGEASQIILHVNLLDTNAVLQQDALGVFGVNLVYAAFYHRDDIAVLVGSLMDGLSRDRIEVDMIKVSGPAFAGVDNRLLSLQLVEMELTDAAMFTADCEVVQPSEVMWKRPVLVVRGTFRPATKLTMELLERARDQFYEEPKVTGTNAVVLAEMTINSLKTGANVSHEDFLARAQILHVLGFDVLISRFQPFYEVTDYLAQYTDQMIGIAVGVPTLQEIMDERFYAELGGGTLESIGRLFRRSVKMYVYPTYDPIEKRIVTLTDAIVPPPVDLLRDLLIKLDQLESLGCEKPELLNIQTDDVLARIQSGDPSWENDVPPLVVAQIKEEKLLGWRP